MRPRIVPSLEPRAHVVVWQGSRPQNPRTESSAWPWFCALALLTLLDYGRTSHLFGPGIEPGTSCASSSTPPDSDRCTRSRCPRASFSCDP
jgi:hypothetical protein